MVARDDKPTLDARQEAEALALWRQGKDTEEIAAALGVHEAAVWNSFGRKWRTTRAA